MARILVVDDNADHRVAIAASLKAFGHRVDVASHGGEALDRIREQTPELVLLDLMMPTVDGWETMRRLHVEWGDGGPPVIAVTARTGPDLKTRLRTSGFSGYLGKPFTLDRLTRTVELALGKNSAGEWIELPPGPLDLPGF